jgi:histidine ammonia-lyase
MKILNISELESIEQVVSFVKNNYKIKLKKDDKECILRSFNYLQQKINKDKQPIYGINTGFGSLCNTKINPNDLGQLQVNLLRSHACGCGGYVPKEIVKLMLLLKIINLSKGYSGVQLPIVEELVKLYNNNTIPVVFEMGSLGASGDLAPLAHLSLPLIGEGKVWGENEIQNAKPTNIQLGPKEGLALINGTQFMQAYGIYILNMAKGIMKRANINAAGCVDAYRGVLSPFLPYSHIIRPHLGQQKVAREILSYLQDSEIQKLPNDVVQDPYSFRCAPQVHGTTYEVIKQVKKIFEVEMNSVTDNPNIFIEEDLILSAGNFHGQILALHLDFLAIALAEIGSIAERRIYRLMEGRRGLPPFLTNNAGLESGLMIAQYTAASLVSQNKQYCTPSSIDNIESSNGQEDHVSMGANAALKCLKVAENVLRIQAIELLAINRAIHLRRPLKSSPIIENEMTIVDQVIGNNRSETILSDLILKIENEIIRNDAE